MLAEVAIEIDSVVARSVELVVIWQWLLHGSSVNS